MANSGTFKKGDGRPRKPKGTPNKSTAAAREAIGRFVDGNSARLQEWLDQIALTDGPKAAMQCFSDLIEYHVPKLARTEVTGKDGAPVSTVVNHYYEAVPDMKKQAEK